MPKVFRIHGRPSGNLVDQGSILCLVNNKQRDSNHPINRLQWSEVIFQAYRPEALRADSLIFVKEYSHPRYGLSSQPSKTKTIDFLRGLFLSDQLYELRWTYILEYTLLSANNGAHGGILYRS